MQVGAKIRVSVADVGSDPLLSWYWPPNTSVHRGSYSETDSATTTKKQGHRLKNTDGIARSP